MKNLLFLASCLFLVLFFSTQNIYADEVIPGEAMIKKYENVKTIQKGKQMSVLVEVYGIPHSTEPVIFKDCQECKYINVMVINKNGYIIGLASLIKIVDEVQYPNGKWSGYIVVKIIIK